MLSVYGFRAAALPDFFLFILDFGKPIDHAPMILFKVGGAGSNRSLNYGACQSFSLASGLG
jgi:hypothetical protein